MMVTFVSQCEKKALNRTRRVLDAFANRIGDNTWQTVITQEGLLAVKKLLRKTASKNTAVSCHWIRSRSRSELVWVVGNKNKFNAEGVVPVNSTRRDLLKQQIENDWKYLPLIKALVAVSALLHDWGKASVLFQKKLAPNSDKRFKGDPIRHEWISCLLLCSLIKAKGSSSDKGWLSALSNGDLDEKVLKHEVAHQAVNPLADIPTIAKLVAWLIVSHHRLPVNTNKEFEANIRSESAETIDDVLRRITQQWSYENRQEEKEYLQRVNQCFDFPEGLLSDSSPWLKQIKKWAKRLLDCVSLANQVIDDGSFRVILHHSRLCLMLGDHFYSSQVADKQWPSHLNLHANTDFKTGQLKQQLDEHLVGVARSGLKTAHLLPAFETEPPVAEDVAALKKRSPQAYQWQDKAVSEITKWRKENEIESGFFAVNMASTGCGKTFANAKVMRALSNDQKSLRFVLALGLRTLTLQTGDEYRERVGLDNSELAVLIGSRAVLELHRQSYKGQAEGGYESSGSLSEEPLLDEDVDYDCAIPESGLSTVLTCERDRKFLYAPVLTCTIDHLMAATETKRGGRYILPALRLMSSDLVIDEVDDFSGFDLIAIGRLIHLAGMLGRKVMISSATIPPDLALGYFKAYRDGWRLYCNTRDSSVSIGCAWVDEFSTQVVNNDALDKVESVTDYRNAHEQFVQKRVSNLKRLPVKRKADMTSCESIVSGTTTKKSKEEAQSEQATYFELIAQSAFNKHIHHHCVDSSTQLKVSFGVIRMANISPCVALTKYFLSMECPENIEIRVMAYHSQQVLLLRHIQEEHLDQVLKRKEESGAEPAAFHNSYIRQHLDDIATSKQQIKDVIFILVATPVEEVGRDHDFDWAVVEPSSFRSIIQLAGRVRRHRSDAVHVPNISLMQYNWKGIKYRNSETAKVFNRPGFEEELQLKTHNLSKLVDIESLAQGVDAIPRIQKPDVLRETLKLSDLEHYVIRKALAPRKSEDFLPGTLQGYLESSWFLTAYPQKFAPFRKQQSSMKVYLTCIAEGENYVFCEKNDRGIAVDREQPLNILRSTIDDCMRDRLWLERSFANEVESRAMQSNLSLRKISLRYGELGFLYNEHSLYEYSDQFGLVKRNEH